MFVYPYNSKSKSAKEVARGLGGKRIKLRNSNFKPHPNKTIINWGSSSMPQEYFQCKVLNKPSSVGIARNKLEFFSYISYNRDVNIPEWTTSKSHVLEDIYGEDPDEVFWLARKVLTGNSGCGIELIKGSQVQIPDARLYTKYIKKVQEYRVHVFNGEVLLTQRKARSRSVPDNEVNWYVRNHSNGFIFAQFEDVEYPDEVIQQGIKAVSALGLDFGSVDVVWDDVSAYVLEVNTASGVTGSTLQKYLEAFGRYES